MIVFVDIFEAKRAAPGALFEFLFTFPGRCVIIDRGSLAHRTLDARTQTNAPAAEKFLKESRGNFFQKVSFGKTAFLFA